MPPLQIVLSIPVVLYLLAVHTSSSFIVYPFVLAGTRLADYEKKLQTAELGVEENTNNTRSIHCENVLGR